MVREQSALKASPSVPSLSVPSLSVQCPRSFFFSDRAKDQLVLGFGPLGPRRWNLWKTVSAFFFWSSGMLS